MAFVTIYKGEKSLRVPRRAYEKQYAPAGWSLEDEAPIQNPSEEGFSQEITPEDENHETDTETEAENEEDSDQSLDGEEDEDEANGFNIEELEEQPLSELSVPELRALAEHKGIDIAGLTSAKKLREAIKDAE